MNCKNCGNEIKENQKFCTKCGYCLDSTLITSKEIFYAVLFIIIVVIVGSLFN